MKYNIKNLKKPSHHHREILERRGMDPANYLVIKNTRTSLWLWDLRIGKVRIVTKWV